MISGYNWRNTLDNFANLSGILAGFCVTFIVLILGWDIAHSTIYEGLTFGHISILLFGISTGLFIASSELFLHAKEFDMFGLSKEYEKYIKKFFKNENRNWEETIDESIIICRQNESKGRNFYNCAIFFLFMGLLFVIIPHSFGVAILVSALGISLQFTQLAKSDLKSKLPKNVRFVINCLILSFIIFVVAIIEEFSVKMFYSSDDPIIKIGAGLIAIFAIALLLIFTFKTVRGTQKIFFKMFEMENDDQEE